MQILGSLTVVHQGGSWAFNTRKEGSEMACWTNDCAAWYLFIKGHPYICWAGQKYGCELQHQGGQGR